MQAQGNLMRRLCGIEYCKNPYLQKRSIAWRLYCALRISCEAERGLFSSEQIR